MSAFTDRARAGIGVINRDLHQAGGKARATVHNVAAKAKAGANRKAKTAQALGSGPAPYVPPAQSASWQVRAVELAKSLAGGPYFFGGKIPDYLKPEQATPSAMLGERGIDCSGLTEGCIRLAGGPKLPDGSMVQAECGVEVDESGIQIGDLVFVADPETGKVHHVAICDGEGCVVEAIGEKWGIGVTPIDKLRNRGRLFFRRV